MLVSSHFAAWWDVATESSIQVWLRNFPSRGSHIWFAGMGTVQGFGVGKVQLKVLQSHIELEGSHQELRSGPLENKSNSIRSFWTMMPNWKQYPTYLVSVSETPSHSAGRKLGRPPLKSDQMGQFDHYQRAAPPQCWNQRAPAWAASHGLGCDWLCNSRSFGVGPVWSLLPLIKWKNGWYQAWPSAWPWKLSVCDLNLHPEDTILNGPAISHFI